MATIIEDTNNDQIYMCSITWVKTPSSDKRTSITRQLFLLMTQSGYMIPRVNDDEQKLILFCLPRKPTQIEAVTMDWNVAYDSLDQQMYATNPECVLAPIVPAGNVDLSEIMTGDIAGAVIDISHGQPSNQVRAPQSESTLSTQQHDPLVSQNSNDPLFDALNHPAPVAAQQAGLDHVPENDPLFDALRVGPAPVFTASASMATWQPSRNETLEEKKRRALALLEREGLIGFGSV